jgi:hypothetical protein
MQHSYSQSYAKGTVRLHRQLTNLRWSLEARLECTHYRKNEDIVPLVNLQKQCVYTKMKFRVFWDIALCSIIGMDRRFRGAYFLHHQGDKYMEAVRTSETSVHSNETTRRYIPEDSILHTRRENLKSHKV